MLVVWNVYEEDIVFATRHEVDAIVDTKHEEDIVVVTNHEEVSGNSQGVAGMRLFV